MLSRKWIYYCEIQLTFPLYYCTNLHVADCDSVIIVPCRAIVVSVSWSSAVQLLQFLLSAVYHRGSCLLLSSR